MPEILLPTKTQVETLDTKVGTNVDVGGTITLFARAKQIYDNIVTNLGSNADASSATGSVHAKLKDIKDNAGSAIDVTRCIPFTKESNVKTIVVANTYETLLSISGKGFLTEAILQMIDTQVSYGIKITIDGTVVAWSSTANRYRFIGLSQYNNLFIIATNNTLSTGTFRVINDAGGGTDIPHGDFPTRPGEIVTAPGFPSTAEKANGIYLLSAPVFFQTSLLVQIMCQSGNNLSYRLQGGYY